MSYNSQEKKCDEADTDLYALNVTIEVPPKPGELRRLIPHNFQDRLPSSKNSKNKEFQGTDHQQVQSVVTTEFPDKDPKNSKTEVDSHKEVLHLDGVFEKNVNIWEEDFIQGKGAQNPSSPIPRDEFFPSVTIYGTGEAFKQLALNHDAEEMKTGSHRVYTDPRFAQILLHNHEDEEKLGKGTFGVVTRGKGPNGLEYVRKRIVGKKFHPTEAIFTNSANHPNIIKSFAIGLLLDFGTVEILMEFAGQSLHSMVERKALDKHIILSLTLDICSGLDFLESKKVVHFDIKPRNLFVQGDERKGYLLKIGDFGSAYMPGDKHKMKSFTLTYCAPEMAQLVLKRKNPDSISQSKQELEQRLQPKTDIFSAGLVVGFMHKGKILLSFLIKSNVSTKSEREQIILKFLSDPDAFMNSDLIPEQAEQEMKKILQKMLQFHVEKRYSANDTLEQIKALLFSRARDQNISKTLPKSFVGEHGEEKNRLGTRSRDVRKKEKLQSPAPPAFLLNDGQLEGFQTKEKKIGLPTQGYQTGSFMQGDQMGSSTKKNTQEFNQESLPLEQPMYDASISENSNPICQAEDDWTVQDPIQESVPGNLPNL